MNDEKTVRRGNGSSRATTPCGRRFAEELLSGWIDGALTQGDEQRVRVHLEDCAECRARVEEMTQLREVIMTTRFQTPADDQWDETPHGAASRFTRSAGWLLVGVWLVCVTGYVLWGVATGPQGWFEKSLVFGGLLGLLLLFVSVLLDRLRVMPGDRYRGVER
jgi:predicted anti-sigma-YlaC factor YlaD